MAASAGNRRPPAPQIREAAVTAYDRCVGAAVKRPFLFETADLDRRPGGAAFEPRDRESVVAGEAR